MMNIPWGLRPFLLVASLLVFLSDRMVPCKAFHLHMVGPSPPSSSTRKEVASGGKSWRRGSSPQGPIGDGMSSDKDLIFTSQLQKAAQLTAKRRIGVFTPAPSAPSLNKVAAPSDYTPSPCFRVHYNEDKDAYEFQTAVVKMRRKSGEQAVEVSLVGTVHIGEPPYYQAVASSCQDCQLVLVELITSRDNLWTDSATGRDRLLVGLQATAELEQMAKTHGLTPQLNCLDFRDHANWYISDIDRETLVLLQRSSGEAALDDPVQQSGLLRHLTEVGQVFWGGFTSQGKILPRFSIGGGFISDLLVQLLRLGLWLTPCPEAELLLLDWARQYPPAGGLSGVLRSMVAALSQADWVTLRRLAFAQMLTSSQATVLSPEGAPRKRVLVGERNSKVLLDLDKALREGNHNVGIVYGGLHLQDMERKLVDYLGFERVGTSWNTAWHMPAYQRNAPQHITNLLCLALPIIFLGVDALDWSTTFGAVAQEVSTGGAHWVKDVGRLLFLYVLRHVYIYYAITRWIVQWDKRLFDVSGQDESD